MNCYDIVYIKGNPASGTPIQHNQINKSILEIIKKYHYMTIESEYKNLSDFMIPKAKIYIGFSRGSRYLKKLPSDVLKISIGGIKGKNVHRFTNEEDKILEGDMSEESMSAHFTLTQINAKEIEYLIEDFLNIL